MVSIVQTKQVSAGYNRIVGSTTSWKHKLTQIISQAMKRILLFMLCWLLLFSVRAQQRTVTGRVVDKSDDSALPGVSIVIKGTTSGTTTDSNGSFSLQAGEGDVLTFSFVGYEVVEINVGAQTTINVSMNPSISTLQEIVVIGYGEKSRALLTESIGTVNSEDITKVPVASPDAALQGRVSGVQVTSVDGTPGSPVAVRIRGVGTVGNTQPLFVIDGIPVGANDDRVTNPLAALNPSDIENISVLKDASAQAVYGVRAANGVVLITTKRGKDGVPKITLDSYYGVQNFPELYDWNNTNQYVQLANEAVNARNAQLGLNPGDDGHQLLHPDFLPGSQYLNINTDWQNPLLNKNAPIQNHHLSVSGGNDKANYFVSAGYFGQEATVRKWNLERFNFRANGDYKVGKRLRFGNTFNISQQNVKRGMNGGGDGFLFGTANLPPFFEIYDRDNSIPNNRYGFNGNNLRGGLTIANQYGINEIVDNRDETTRILGGIHAELDILKSLTFRSAASIDLNVARNTSWRPAYTSEEVGLSREINEFNDSRGFGHTQVFTNTLNFQKTFGDHSVNALAGIEYQRLRNYGMSLGGQDFLSANRNFYISVRNQRGQYSVGSSVGEDAYVGYIGRVSYDYKQKYLLTVSVRRDGTAHFSPENRWGTFPSFSAAWRVSEEDFFSSVAFINDLKIRGSFGQLGNAQTAQYSHISRVSATPDYALGGVNRQAPTQLQLPNREIGWETVQTADIGFDVTFFENKFNLLATYYERTTKDFLYNLPIPLTGGFGNIWGPGSNVDLPVNAGEVSNRGFEFELGYTTTISNGLTLNLSGNITTIKNRLEALAPGYLEFASGDYRTAVGYPIGYFYGYKTSGLYQNDGEAEAALDDETIGNNEPQPGDVRFVDTNGPADADAPQGVQYSGVPDGIITPADRTYLGKTIPDFFYGISMNANFKSFDFSMLFQGVSGVQVYNEFRRDNESLTGAGRNTLVSTQNRWTGEGTSNSMPRAVSQDFNQNSRFSDRWIENAGFLRMRNVQLGYTVPKSILEKTRAISSLRIYVSASNLFKITKYSGLDPEVMTYGSNGYQTGAGTDSGNIPQPRTFTGGVQLSF